MTIAPFGLPPEEAIGWFRSKGFATSFDWRDTWREEHARAFTVAKATQLDVLADIREAVDDAITNGRSFEEFKKSLRPTLQKKGWWGEQEQVDPQTGESKLVQLGSAHRLRVIYDTNLRTAHAAGKWQSIERNAQRRPYLRYIARKPGPTRRDEHQKLNDLVRPISDPIWQTIYPPNGWGCKCGVQQLSERDVERFGLTISAPIQLTYRSWTNQRTGEVLRVPQGIDPGFDYNVGMGRGGLSPHELPTLTPTRNFRDYGRPAASDATRVAGPALGEAAPKGPGRAARVRDLFRGVFGTTEGAPSRTITDPTGVEVVFDERVLPQHIARSGGRERYLAHAREAVRDPYEIWLVPYRQKDGSVVIRQRYVSLFKDELGLQKDVLVVVGHNGAFNVYPHDRIDSERVGYLHHSRGS